LASSDLRTGLEQDCLLPWRNEFPILGKTTYLISNSLGAMPRGVYQSLESYARCWDTRGVRAWEEQWWQLPGKVADRMAHLLGASSGSISLHQNVTLAQAVVASCFDFKPPKNKIVMVDLEFPSVLYFFKEQERRGARIALVQSDDGIGIDTEKVISAIDQDTLLVPISYVLFRSAYILDAKSIIEHAHRMGAHVILDCFQAAGTVPFHLGDLQADFALGGVLKWLCGGPGVAYLYVRPDLQPNLRPALTGWMAHQRPFDFEAGEIELRQDSYRFMNGTPHIPSLHACLPGLEIIASAGIAEIRRKSSHQTQRILEGAGSRGWKVNTPANADIRGGTVSLECPHAAEVCKELLLRDILVDYRPKAGIRISPHFYSKDDEMDYALQQIDDILATGAWKVHKSPSI
jgi:kynureninase